MLQGPMRCYRGIEEVTGAYWVFTYRGLEVLRGHTGCWMGQEGVTRSCWCVTGANWAKASRLFQRPTGMLYLQGPNEQQFPLIRLLSVNLILHHLSKTKGQIFFLTETDWLCPM